MSSKLNQYLLEKHNSFLRLNACEFSTEEELLNFAATNLKAQRDIIELFAPQWSGNILFNTAKKLRELTAVFDALFLIYDRIDIVKLTNADGVTLDNKTINIQEAQKLCENSFLIGFYVNNEQEATEAQEKKADFLISSKNYQTIKIKQFLK